MNIKSVSLPFIFGLATFVGLSATALSAKDNMYFHGILVDEPCTIKPGDETVELDFGNIPDKNLYAYQRTPSKPFQIRLSECDLTIGKNVRITFKGDENQAMAGQGFLAISPASQASGIAVGLESENGNALPVNKETDKLSLNANDTILHFYAFIQGEPDAIANQAIKRGPFSAIATFHLNYD
ncbi:TPA: type 1 fimbrial protein [Escherichia coli]|uniref:Minor fimbrial subunit n=1 Tax=Proteus hauseri ATCC 700826 TaxID=1354271 RepID=A0AAJ3HT81_PROHU|nr:fimbrial protein [Proteus hauseri]OAT48235.1 minor fimbrial subunit [Proteus hauseri ATCC 700826]QAV23881.1 type 1 fimbrial protein [Proteus hauseri]HCH49127.1 type 1 fimbrial protein [Proteus sp. (in: enterobacteria)]HDH9217363.1 type 1 fimbrial protein [Escherichia coli]